MAIFKNIKNEKGQSIVELAILIPFLLIMLMGIFEFGRIMNTQLVITYASREGVRSASVGASDEEIVEIINKSLSSLNSSCVNISITPDKISRTRGTAVSVKVEYDVDIIVPIIENIIPNPLHLEAETFMRVE